MKLTKSPFGFKSTAEEVSTEIDLKGKNAIVTGAASGIGIETARVLALRGADVTLAVRNVQAGNDVAEDPKKKTGNSNIHVDVLELADICSLRWFSMILILRSAAMSRGPLTVNPSQP